MARNLFKPWDQKRNEAVDKLYPELQRHLSGIKRQARRQLSQARDQLLGQISDAIKQLAEFETAARNLAQTLDSAANDHGVIRLDIDRQIVTLALKQAGATDINDRILRVEREPGQETVIITALGTRHLTGQPLRQLEQLLGEAVAQRYPDYA